MTDFERWDVVTALFPFTDVDVRKPRPVLVLSSRSFNREHQQLVAVMITTGAGSSWPTDHRLISLDGTGLSHSSLVRWKFFTLPTSLIGKRIGMLANADRAAVAARVASIFIA